MNYKSACLASQCSQTETPDNFQKHNIRKSIITQNSEKSALQSGERERETGCYTRVRLGWGRPKLKAENAELLTITKKENLLT